MNARGSKTFMALRSKIWSRRDYTHLTKPVWAFLKMFHLDKRWTELSVCMYLADREGQYGSWEHITVSHWPLFVAESSQGLGPTPAFCCPARNTGILGSSNRGEDIQMSRMGQMVISTFNACAAWHREGCSPSICRQAQPECSITSACKGKLEELCQKFFLGKREKKKLLLLTQESVAD